MSTSLIMLLSSIVTVTGVVVFFLFSFTAAAVSFLKGRCSWCMQTWCIGQSLSSRKQPATYAYYDDDNEGEEEEASSSSANPSSDNKKFCIEESHAGADAAGKGRSFRKKKGSSVEMKSKAGDHHEEQEEGTLGAMGEGYTLEDSDDSDSDMDIEAYISSGLLSTEEYTENHDAYFQAVHASSSSASSVQSSPNFHNLQSAHFRNKKAKPKEQSLYGGDILTITMVWTNVYGLGAACFFLMYIITMASTLATYTFIVSLYSVCVYEAFRERMMPYHKQWHAGKMSGQIRHGLHMFSLCMGFVVVCLLGVHIGSIQMNKPGHIATEDIFFAILAPLITPWLLKGVRRPHTTIMGSLEISLPFAAFVSLSFMVTALAMDMKPYEVRDELSRNMVAVTIILPVLFGGVIMHFLYFMFRRRMLYVFAAFVLVFTGREFTLDKTQSMVWASFLLSSCMFGGVIMASSKRIIQSIARH